MPTDTPTPTLWRQPRWRAKAALSLTLVLATGAYLADRYRIGIDDQKTHCLPPYTVWLIDTHDRTVARGRPFAFYASGAMQPWFREGQVVIKRLVALPGDTVTVSGKDTRINDRNVGEGLDLATKLKRSESDFVRETVLPQDVLWMMGDTRNSFDSRYWGPLDRSQLMGRAYGLL
jgi:conjugal transfer pilin signal peptidase TrbI